MIDENEITPAMLHAGSDALDPTTVCRLYDSAASPAAVAEKVFLAMLRAYEPPPYGPPPLDGEIADVSGPPTGNASAMRRKFIGETAQKVVNLADIYRIPD